MPIFRTLSLTLIVVASTIVFTIITLMPLVGEAQQNSNSGFVPISQGLPDDIFSDANSQNGGKLLNTLFRYGVIAAGFLAVIMIVVGGFQDMTTDAVSGKSKAKSTITSALSGLFLILLSAVLLSLINPDILSFSFFTPR